MSKIIPPTFITQSEEALDKGYDPKVARGLLQFVKPYTWQMLIALVFMIFVTSASVLGPYFVELAIEMESRANDPAALKKIVLIFFAVSVVQLGVNYMRVRIMSRVGQHVLYDVRTAMFDHLQKLSLSFYNRYSVGRVITRVINDVGTLREFITWAVLAIVRNILGIIGTIIAMMTLESEIVPADFCCNAFHGLGDDYIQEYGAQELSQGARRGFVGKLGAGGKYQRGARGSGIFASGT